MNIFSSLKRDLSYFGEVCFQFFFPKAYCRSRQRHLDSNTRPRTETHEYLTCRRQRDIFLKNKPIRDAEAGGSDRYTDYREAQRYHDEQ